MSEPEITQQELLRAKLNSETARIPWKDLQRYFAGGYTWLVAQELDLIDVAYQVHQDNASQVEQWMSSQQLRQVRNDEARRWYNDDAELWACVIKPWVLIQPMDQ